MPTGGLCPNFPEKTLLPTSIFLSAIFLSSLFVEVDDRAPWTGRPPLLPACMPRAAEFHRRLFLRKSVLLTFLRP